MKKGGTVIKGNCYEVNGRWMIGKNGYKLVHGVAMNQKDGKSMGHCWIEKDDLVYDYSNDKELIPRGKPKTTSLISPDKNINP